MQNFRSCRTPLALNLSRVVFLTVIGLFPLVQKANAFIIGGADVEANDPIQKSTAAIYEPSSTGPGGSLCTASVIGPNTAVTAAHCIQPGGRPPVMLFGPDVHSAKMAPRPVTGSIVNPKYATHQGRGMDQGDIAVVKFGGGLPPGYSPAELDSANDVVKRGDTATLAGYGVSNAATHSGSGRLRKTTVAVSAARSKKSEMILDQSHGRGACHGDSGGPAYLQRGGHAVLAGITNRSYPNSAPDDCGHKVVYTKVAAYRPWIADSQAKLNRSDANPSGAGGEFPTVAPMMRQNMSQKTGQNMSAKVDRKIKQKTRATSNQMANRESSVRQTPTQIATSHAHARRAIPLKPRASRPAVGLTTRPAVRMPRLHSTSPTPKSHSRQKRALSRSNRKSSVHR